MKKTTEPQRTANHLPTVTIDSTYKRIRIHRNTLSCLDNPAYIQLLVNPEQKTLVICKSKSKNPTALKVKYQQSNGKSYELYSTTLVDELLSFNTFESLHGHIRLSGAYIKRFDIVVFHLEDKIKHETE